MFSTEEILETIKMVALEGLDIRTVTMGVNLYDCAGANIDRVSRSIFRKVSKAAKNLVKVCGEIESEFAIPIINKRVSVSPIADVAIPAIALTTLFWIRPQSPPIQSAKLSQPWAIALRPSLNMFIIFF